jgi:hypothetical protein
MSAVVTANGTGTAPCQIILTIQIQRQPWVWQVIHQAPKHSHEEFMRVLFLL